MGLIGFALRNIRANALRSWIIGLCAFLVAGLAIGAVMFLRGADSSLRLANERLGADIVVVPEGELGKVEEALLMAHTTRVWMPAENLDKIAAVSGVQAASPQIYLSTLSNASCCSVSDMFLIAYDPTTDFALQPWLVSTIGQGLKLGEVVGGDYVFTPEGQENISIYGFLVTLKANLDETGTGIDQSMFMTVETAREIARMSVTLAEQPLEIPEGNISAVMVKLAPGADAEKTADEIRRTVPGVSPVVSANLFQTQRRQFGALRVALVTILVLTVILSLVLIGLVYSLAANARRTRIGCGPGHGRRQPIRVPDTSRRGFRPGCCRCPVRHRPRRRVALPLPHLYHQYHRAAPAPAFAVAADFAGTDWGRAWPGCGDPRCPGACTADQPSRSGHRDAGVSAMISLENVSKTYEARRAMKVSAVHAVSLEIPDCEFAVVTGRSGSGKTTLLNLAAGLTRPTSGRVLLNGQDLWLLSDRERSTLRSQKIGFVFQFPSLLPSLTVIENVGFPAMFSRGRIDRPAYEQAHGLLGMVGMADKLNAYPSQLSAGQQQRAVIARSLMNRPEVLLADEPTSNLDEQTEQEIMQLFANVHQELGLTILLVTHSSQLVSYGTRALSLSEGGIVA